jgi:hypothetical protein
MNHAACHAPHADRCAPAVFEQLNVPGHSGQTCINAPLPQAHLGLATPQDDQP